LQHALFVEQLPFTDTARQCTLIPPAPTGQRRLANGMQIFSGGVPIYRGNQLVGAIGISGDGIDQDDMVSFLGLHRAGERLGGAIGNAPNDIRADRLTPVGARLRYVSCPFNPFLNSRGQNPCQGK
ncbi:MAG TPA: heme-binding protein, partial [Azospirillaceae bacterium]|nr:heme-binding protein [Azospirillaceae bacterium]